VIWKGGGALLSRSNTFEEEHTMTLHTKAISWKQSFVDEARLQAQRTNGNKALSFFFLGLTFVYNSSLLPSSLVLYFLCFSCFCTVF
jgi:hypothetical protein